jgi:hypothetical protein
VIALVDRSSEEVLNYVAAGPLEDVLRQHGAAVIDRIIERADRDLKWRRALEGVWGAEDDPVVAGKLADARRRWSG